MKRVIEITEDNLFWGFNDTAVPHWKTQPRLSDYAYQMPVDPTPCYSHPRKLVVELVRNVEAIFPIPVPPNWYILPREPLARTNGWAGYHGQDETYEPYIALCGKRIPLHPAMTRYLVAHEYGHTVEYAILTKLGHRPYGNEVVDEYAKMRGIEPVPHYGPGFWHLSPTEVFANDFRVYVAKAEVEFWPHPGVKPPDQVKAVRDWWDNALREYAA